MSRRRKACVGKVAFHTYRTALCVAEKYNQTVYECPVCFCYHCTSLQNWRDEFVPVQKHQNVVKQLDAAIEKLSKLQGMKKINGDLLQENQRLWKFLRQHNLLPDWSAGCRH